MILFSIQGGFMEKQEWYKIYLPIEVEYRQQIRLLAAKKDKGPGQYLAMVVKEYLAQHKVELDPELPMEMKAS